MSVTKRLLSCTLALTMAFTGYAQTAQATMIGTEQVAQSQRVAGEAHAKALAALDRADVAAALSARGVDVQQARERVASLTDDEAARLAYALDHAPAGGDVLGTIVFIFVLLLVTDILGFTRIFPFTRPIR